MNFKKLEQVEAIVLHCSATKPTHDVSAEDIDRWHRERGWLAIGYHKVIRRDGTVENGRPIDVMGAHVRGHNHNSIGICIAGGVNDEGEPESNYTPDQWMALALLLQNLKLRHPTAKVIGHNDLDSHKACPSFQVSDHPILTA